MKLIHPASGQEIDVRADSLALYESQGWTRVKPTRPHRKATTVLAVPDETPERKDQQ